MNTAPAVAEPWSLFIGFAGKSFLVIAIVLFALATILLIKGKEKPAYRLFLLGAFGFVGAFACIATLFITHQFQYKYVFEHSALNHEFQYLIAGVWSGQEGSFLLWGLMAAIVGVIAARGAGAYRKWFTVVYSLLLAGIAAILTLESPFDLLPLMGGQQLIPFDGLGMAPSLLNYWVVIHPPTIFLGFGTLSVLYAYSLSAVISKDLRSWIPLVRPWALFCLAILGLGLSMGGFWAYETLGWGGFWAWDPVENTSFVPWCIVIAFVHGMFVQQARKKWFIANAIFAALPFLLFCYGTFLTRSGFLGDTSVHSFAEMDSTALWFLIVLGVTAILAFIGFVLKNGKNFNSNEPPPEVLPLNRQLLYGIGIWLLSFFAIITAFGMSFPWITSWFFNKPRVIEEGLYHDLLVWAFVPFMLVMAIAPYINWNGLTPKEVFNRLVNSLAITVGIIGCILLWMKSPDGIIGQILQLMKVPKFVAPGKDEAINVALLNQDLYKVSWVLFLVGLCLFVAISSFWRMMESLKRAKTTVWAMMAHFGLALTMFGLIFSRGFEQKVQVVVHKKEQATVFGYDLVEKGQTSQFSDRNNKIKIEAKSKDSSFTALPGLYFMKGNGNEPAPMIWPHIQQLGLVDYYFTIFQPVFEATGPTEIPFNPNKPESRAYKNMVLLYNGFRTVGDASMMGQVDIALVANITVVTKDGSQDLEPAIIIGKDRQITPIEARINEDYKIKLIKIDPETRAATIQIIYVDPAYPLEVYFKPLTLFVWLGVGIMTLGGLLSAVSRRKERQGVTTDATEPSS